MFRFIDSIAPYTGRVYRRTCNYISLNNCALPLNSMHVIYWRARERERRTTKRALTESLSQVHEMRAGKSEGGGSKFTMMDACQSGGGPCFRACCRALSLSLSLCVFLAGSADSAGPAAERRDNSTDGRRNNICIYISFLELYLTNSSAQYL